MPSAPRASTAPGNCSSARRQPDEFAAAVHELDRTRRGSKVAVADTRAVRAGGARAGDRDVRQRAEIVQRLAVTVEHGREFAVAHAGRERGRVVRDLERPAELANTDELAGRVRDPVERVRRSQRAQAWRRRDEFLQLFDRRRPVQHVRRERHVAGPVADYPSICPRRAVTARARGKIAAVRHRRAVRAWRGGYATRSRCANSALNSRPSVRSTARRAPDAGRSRATSRAPDRGRAARAGRSSPRRRPTDRRRAAAPRTRRVRTRPRDGAGRRRAAAPIGPPRRASASACATASRSCRAPGTPASRRRGRAAAQVVSSSRCVGTHCSGALLITTSASAGIVHVVTSCTRKSMPPIDSAAAIISGDESMPSTTASGHRSASSAVSVPGPQPRSTTRRGAAASMRASRSRNGRPRSSA